MPNSEQRPAPALRRVMRFGDLLLFYIVTAFSLRWIAPAAAAGPSAIVVWVGAALVFYAPLVLSTIELSSRYPEEGGMYAWSKRAFGPFAGFLTGWNYWACNLPYYPALLYFAAGNALFVGGGGGWQHLAADRTYYILFALAGLALAAGLNVRGLDVGKWLHNAGAVANWLPATLLIALGAVAAVRFGSAADFGG